MASSISSWKIYAAGRVSRRQVLRTTALTGAGLLAACGGNTTTRNNTANTAPTTAANTAAGSPAARQAAATASPAAIKKGGTLTSVLAADPPNFHALNEIGVSVDAVTSLMYNTLIRTNPGSLKPEADLAQTWEVAPDGMSYTFHLFPDAKWHLGSPVTSQDVKASYEYYLSKPAGLNTRKTDYLANVTKVTAPDDHTVQIQLDQPRASFLDSIGIGYMQIAPQAQIAADPSFFQTRENGSGPFKLDSFTPGTEVKLSRNANYFKAGLPYLDNIALRVVKDSTTRVQLYQTGGVDMSWSSTTLSPTELDNLKQGGSKWTIDNIPSGGFVGIFENMTKPPLDDVRVRRAITFAVDRQAATQVLSQGQGEVGAYITPGPFAIPKDQLLQQTGYRQAHDQDVAQAKQLLAQAGFGNGLSIPAIYATDLGPANEPAALFAKDQLARVGIQLQLQPLLYADINKLRASKDWQIWVNQTAREGADPFFAAAHLASNNLFGVADKETFDLFDKQAVTVDQAQRKALVTQLENHLLDIAPYAPFFFQIVTTVRAPYVKGFTPTGNAHLWVPQFDGVSVQR